MLHRLHGNKKRILYTICFLFFCIIDQRIKTGSGLDGWIETFRSLTGVVVAVLILSHYPLNEFKEQKIPYLVWSLICVVGGALFIAKGQAIVWFFNERVAWAVNALLYGYIVIRLCAIHLCGSVGREQGINKWFSCAWLVMMGLMCASRSDYHWPAAYLIMFLCFYLTDYTAEELENLFQGMLNGIILGFFLMQGWCFAFRPYDEVRYVGVYNNSNLNALFYLVVLAAVLSKLLYVYAKNSNKWVKLYYWAGTGTLLGFIFMTIGRTGWMTAAIMVFVGLLLLGKVVAGQKPVSALLKRGLLVVLCFMLLFPAVYGAVRYLPPLFHHPVWFFGEWNEDKVHSWDPWDSEKFISLDKLMRTANKRVAVILESALGMEPEHAGYTGAVQPEAEETVTPQQQQLYDQAYEAGFAIDPADRKKAVLVRKSIYRYYIHLLNLTGHPESEQGFQIMPSHRIGHAHNIYLQWGVDFGIPAMLLFLALIVRSVVGLLRNFWRNQDVRDGGYLLFLLVPCVFGLLEYAWGAGSLTMMALFVVWRRLVRA